MFESTDNVLHPQAIPELGLPADSKTSTILLALLERIIRIESALENEIYPPDREGEHLTAGKVILKGTAEKSAEAALLEGQKLGVRLTRSDSVASVEYDAVPKDLPSGFNVLSTSVNVRGALFNGRTQIVSSKKPAMKVEVAYNRFPVTVDARVVVSTPRGDIELRREATISSDNEGDQSIGFEVIDRTPLAADMSVEDAYKLIDNRVKVLEKASQVNG